MKSESRNSRRDFLAKSGSLLAGSLFIHPISEALNLRTNQDEKLRIAMVGTGIRGTTMYGRDVMRVYKDQVEFVGLCDINEGRVRYAKDFIGVECPVYTDCDEMISVAKPDVLIVTTMDSTHSDFIVKGLNSGLNVITEKPMTTDEFKCQSILDAERKSGKKVIVTFNYRYSPHRQKIYEMLRAGEIGDITSVDFHWYLNTSHGADYFRRWHGYRDKSGTLLVHKSTHHFDLLNWWLNSDPEEVYAYGELEFYGKNGPYRGETCRSCVHKDKCDFYWDVTKSQHLTKLYVDNEEYDGYHRDGCVFREDIDIYDKMAVQIRYKNKVQVSYSLTTYSPYEGYRIAFNGTKGRLEAWIKESQPWEVEPQDEIRLTKNFGETEMIVVPHGGGGHGGGDTRLKDKLFKDPMMADPYRQSAGSRDGAMSILVGIAARNSIESGKPVKVQDLTDIPLKESGRGA
ncbi:Gfo/Idh/MocA family protein [Algoriphagus machipongonensis]|uniref:Oxidoreductase family, NAD-binding Rossmann fold domain protein n=1 Tax=Algoriphagus machipongonensis TaxID=388413 RepID=A3HYZ4_9BACT|nr:Gfo/Idh/MocA family oxidoreductase [Algoriphagus machipongonensis]EAZ80480.1 oxidoreductase family, NAD-binding Rossmann fold domain protein [Algoriphagus machipongonensis]